MKAKHIKIISFDADDTLWENQNYFEKAGKMYADIMAPYINDSTELAELLLKNEISNAEIYGFGAKSFTLSMIETALKVSNYKIAQKQIERMIGIGKELLNMPIKLLPDVNTVLEDISTSGKYKLVVATKGDLKDQQRKLQRSGLEQYFDHIEIMSDKLPPNYESLYKKLNCSPQNFLMIGNSMKSDIIPVIESGGFAAHIPFHLTWANEVVSKDYTHKNMIQLNRLSELLAHISL